MPFVALWPWKTLNTGAKRLRKGGGEVGVLACRPREGPTAADVHASDALPPARRLVRAVPQAVAVPYVPPPFPSPAISRCCGPLPLRPRAPVSTEEVSQ